MAVAKLDQTRFTKHEENGGRLAANPLQETLPPPRETWWPKNFKWENLTVAGREVKGFIVTPFAGGLITVVIGVLLSASITITIALYSTMSTQIGLQRDMLIEMKTRLEERTTAAEKIETRRSLEEKMAQDEDRVWRETMGRRMDKVELIRRD